MRADRESAEKGFSADGVEARSCHVSVVALQREVLRPLEDEVRCHQAWRERTSREVVHRLGAMTHRVGEAQ
ncbi:MAG: hypothetical protein E6H83_13350 [Chloroflexi bacterium]|nr:MAG: hypothetical protein E6H83_13350 [Chloroflexota bacterium]